MKEAQYQSELIDRIKTRLPGCIVMKNDCNYLQGVPDLTVLYQAKWALLEVKATEKSKERPNQRHYIDKASVYSFASFIYPEIEEQVLEDLVRHMAA
jgi:hypothetical protein